MATIKFKKLKPYAIVPFFKYKGDAGMDLFSAENYLLNPLERALVSTGICCEFPEGYELQVRSRSGLALKYGIMVLNSPGTIDSGYRGEIGVILMNFGKEIFKIERGDKVAQLVFSRTEIPEITQIEDLSESERGERGFGSSGRK